MTTALFKNGRNRFLHAVMTLSLGLTIAAPPAQAQPDPRTDAVPQTLGAASLPRPITDTDISDMSARVDSRVIMIRVTEQLDPRMHPPFVQWSGVAVWVQPTSDSGTHLVTTHSAVARATSVDVFLNNEWVPARIESLSPWYDLALVVPDGLDAAVDGLPVTDPADARVDAWLAVVNEQSDVTLLSTAIRGHEPGDEGLMLRTPSTALPGSPMLNRDGELLGLVSVRETGRRAQTLVVGATMIAEWWQARGEGGTEVMWRPNVEVEQIDPGAVRDEVRP
jgi:hypothetical protein